MHARTHARTHTRTHTPQELWEKQLSDDVERLLAAPQNDSKGVKLGEVDPRRSRPPTPPPHPTPPPSLPLW